MDKLVPGLILAGLSGVTVVSYKHHDAYIYFYVAIEAVVTLGLTGAAIWELAIDKAHVKLMKFLKPGSFDEADGSVEKLKFLNGWWYVGYFALNFYLWFLLYLPRILDK